MENLDVDMNDVLKSRSRVNESGVRETEKGRGAEGQRWSSASSDAATNRREVEV